MRPTSPGGLSILFLIGFCLGLAGARFWLHRAELSQGRYLLRPGYPPLVYAPDSREGPRIDAASFVLLEATTGTVLYAKDEHVRRAPASTTKIMTALIALEKGRLRDLVTVSRQAGWTPGSSAGLRARDRLPLGELLQGLMLVSGNDAALAIAEHVGGSEAAFVALMNSKAREFGAFNTQFRNPHGLPSIGHLTTAYDLALITRYALQQTDFSRLVRTRDEELVWAEGERRAPISNTNRLLWSFSGADGVKTGTTSEAGHCLVASATRDGRRLIAVVLRSPDRWRDAANLLEYGFNAFRLMVLADEGRPVASIRVAGGSKRAVNLIPRSRLAIVCRQSKENLIKLVKVLPSEPVRAPIHPGRILGRLAVLYGGEEVDGVDLLPETKVPRIHWWRRIFGRSHGQD